MYLRSLRARSSAAVKMMRSEEHTSELQSLTNLVCRLLLEKKKNEAGQVEPGHHQPMVDVPEVAHPVSRAEKHKESHDSGHQVLPHTPDRVPRLDPESANDP